MRRHLELINLFYLYIFSTAVVIGSLHIFEKRNKLLRDISVNFEQI